MFNIDANTRIIELTQGNTAKINFKVLYPSGAEYYPTTTDTITLVVKTAVGGTQKLSKTYDRSTKTFTIAASDTSSIEPGDYIYDVKLVLSLGETYTIVPPTTFRVLPTLQ